MFCTHTYSSYPFATLLHIPAGSSTFYGNQDSKEETTEVEEAAKDTISTSSTQKLEDELEDKPENENDDVFEDATLKLEENGKAKKHSTTS